MIKDFLSNALIRYQTNNERGRQNLPLVKTRTSFDTSARTSHSTYSKGIGMRKGNHRFSLQGDSEESDSGLPQKDFASELNVFKAGKSNRRQSKSPAYPTRKSNRLRQQKDINKYTYSSFNDDPLFWEYTNDLDLGSLASNHHKKPEVLDLAAQDYEKRDKIFLLSTNRVLYYIQ